MKVTWSLTNDPTSWNTEDGGSIQFATPEDAKKAEALFKEMADEISRLREAAEWDFHHPKP